MYTNEMSENEEEVPELVQSHDMATGRMTEVRKDRFFLVYGIFFFCGVVTLLPWNFFITAVSFFKFKLRNTSLPKENYTDISSQTELQVMYENYLVVFASLSNSIFMVTSVVLTNRVRRNSRFLLGNVLLITSFVIIIAFAVIDTDSIQLAFFCISIGMGVLANAGSAFTQGCVVGLAGLFPEKYTKSVMEGQASGGIIAACANILTLYLASDPVWSGLAYFAIALGMILLSIIAFLALPRFKFSQQFISRVDRGDTFSCNSCDPGDDGRPLLNEAVPGEVSVVEPRIMDVLWKVKIQVAGIFFTFLVTLTIFPSILARVQPIHPVFGDPWSTTFFNPVVCFLIFNIGDYTGRFLIGVVGVMGRRFFWLHNLAVVSRLIFLPLVIMCNIQPRKEGLFLPLVFTSDAWPAVFCAIIGISNGYLATSSIILAVSSVRTECMELAGNISVMFLVFGITCGGFVSLALASVI